MLLIKMKKKNKKAIQVLKFKRTIQISLDKALLTKAYRIK
jgi:hypothetical protein